MQLPLLLQRRRQLLPCRARPAPLDAAVAASGAALADGAALVTAGAAGAAAATSATARTAATGSPAWLRQPADQAPAPTSVCRLAMGLKLLITSMRIPTPTLPLTRSHPSPDGCYGESHGEWGDANKPAPCNCLVYCAADGNCCQG